MRKSTCIVVVLASLCVLSLSNPASSETLSGKELKALYPGLKISYSGKSTGTARYNADGTAEANDSKHGKLKGRWWIRGNKYCRVWGKGKARCATIKKIGENLYRSGRGNTLRALNK